jgi:two-component system chemotaxis response regulator CheB
MSSIANYYPYEIIGILLSGMGEDGVEGLRAIKAVNGRTIVQDPATAVVDSMPEAAIKEGLADEILSPEKIVKRIILKYNCTGFI